MPLHTQRPPPFRVLALYNSTWDAAHISFVEEANEWFPEQAAANGFTCTAGTDWDLLADGGGTRTRWVPFLHDLPQTAAQRTGFERDLHRPDRPGGHTRWPRTRW